MAAGCEWGVRRQGLLGSDKAPGDRRHVEWVRVMRPQGDEPQGGTAGWKILAPDPLRHCIGNSRVSSF